MHRFPTLRIFFGKISRKTNTLIFKCLNIVRFINLIFDTNMSLCCKFITIPWNWFEYRTIWCAAFTNGFKIFTINFNEHWQTKSVLCKYCQIVLPHKWNRLILTRNKSARALIGNLICVQIKPCGLWLYKIKWFYFLLKTVWRENVCGRWFSNWFDFLRTPLFQQFSGAMDSFDEKAFRHV